MSQTETESKPTESESRLKVTGYDDKDSFGPCFLVTSPMGNVLKISDTFAEMFPMWVGRVLIT
ncbi:MAG TPA: hypothetical protein VEH86_08365, partial [Candidatus Acidoferrum sp.]|nr:hypothetical protein [Candidatus Acidoferrum sp.]